MNKLVKGSIAGAAGIALLLGGAGTLALWNASASITDTTVSSGTLTLTASNAIWEGDGPMVPGDTVTYTSTLTIKAVGTNLEATLSVDEGSITGVATGDAELAAALEISTAVVGGLPSGITDNGDGTFEVAPSATDITVPVEVTITLPASVGDAPGAGDDAQTQSVNVEGLAFKLDQHL